jgi:hypothetical protein
MKAYEVYLNGRHLVTAGVGLNGVLSTIVTWTTVSPPAREGGEFHFYVGGVDGQTGEHIDWSVPDVGVGDEITIKIIETDQISPEDHRRVFNAQKPGESMAAFRERIEVEGTWIDEGTDSGSP